MKHLILLDGIFYSLEPATGQTLQWRNKMGQALGPLYGHETEALNWVKLMFRYEWTGRGELVPSFEVKGPSEGGIK